MNPIRILIVDDHALLRAGLRGFLTALSGIEVVGEADDGLKALDLLKKLQPDILMTDIAMPGLNGLELATETAHASANTRVIILSMHTEWTYADKALRAGAAGYLVKNSGSMEIELAVRAVARGESYLSPAVSKHIIAGYTRMADTQADDIPLTPRQREVLKLIAEGLTTKAIARQLNISTKTADTHRVQLMDRLNIHDVAGLVRYAIRNRLIDRDI